MQVKLERGEAEGQVKLDRGEAEGQVKLGRGEAEGQVKLGRGEGQDGEWNLTHGHLSVRRCCLHLPRQVTRACRAWFRRQHVHVSMVSCLSADRVGAFVSSHHDFTRGFYSYHSDGAPEYAQVLKQVAVPEVPHCSQDWQ